MECTNTEREREREREKMRRTGKNYQHRRTKK
jgi:hypothetical protein